MLSVNNITSSAYLFIQQHVPEKVLLVVKVAIAAICSLAIIHFSRNLYHKKMTHPANNSTGEKAGNQLNSDKKVERSQENQLNGKKNEENESSKEQSRKEKVKEVAAERLPKAENRSGLPLRDIGKQPDRQNEPLLSHGKKPKAAHNKHKPTKKPFVPY